MAPDIDDLVGAEPAHQAARLTYFEARVNESLYGSPSAPVRWYRSGGDATLGSVVVQGVEVVRLPHSEDADAALAVVHVRLCGDPTETLAELVRQGPNVGFAALLPEGARPVPGQRLQTISHVTFSTEPPARSAEYRDWPPHRQWAWLLASATHLSRNPPDSANAELFVGEVPLSRDWTALVLRDGVAFVGRSADPGGDAESFHRIAQTYVHSLYLDVFLLGRMQLHALNGFANRIATARIDRLDPGALAAMEHRLIEIRRSLWGRHATIKRIGNQLLERYQEQHRLEALMAHIDADLGSASRFLDTLTNRGINAALGLVTVIGLPFGLAYSGGEVWGSPGPRSFWICTAIATVGAVLLALFLPPVRLMIRSLHGGPRR